ncbi:MAG TPA: LuxR C-terminal-related transcriptional regulator [Actinoplanes sp.]
MAGRILETKLHIPGRRRSLVARPRLSERLARGAESALTLVSAPAGFGKTTLLAQWLATAAADDRSTAWLSLDERDNDPAVFWPYLVAALRMATPGVGADALSLLQSPQSPIEAVLSSLLNELDAVGGNVVLVLDDYHVIESREVHDAMAFLLEHLPAQLHLVIGSRADPAFPLARLRARGELVEIRAADLRFTSEEATAYLSEVMGLVLTADDVAALAGRTEGWIAALQLAALSMQGRDDVGGFIAGFAGDDRYIVDYLVEEVLQRQSEQVRSFLLRTSILSRLNGALCDAVTGQHGGRTMLEALDRANLFVVPLDDRRRWYRYHHLFAVVLRTRLLDEQPDHVPDLHRRASAWYEQNNEPPEAIGHAIAGGDFARAADLIELATPALRRSRQEATLRGWLEALPDELLRVRPVLNVGYAATLMITGEIEGVEARLRDAERFLAQSQARSADMVVVDEAAFRGLPSAIALYRAGQARVRGDVAGTMTHARRALDLVGTDDHLGRGAAAALLGLAYWTSGDLDAGHHWSAEGIASLDMAGHVSDVIGCTMALADIRIAQGRLREAMSAYERGMRRATESAGHVLRGAADMHVGMAEIRCERNDLDTATAHLLISDELGEHAGLPQNRYRRRVAMARIRQAHGDLSGALDLLDDAQRLYVSDFFPEVRPIPALRARVWAAQGRWGEALGWAREQDLSTEDELSYLREFAHITLARTLLARYTAERTDRCFSEATALLGRLLSAADQAGRTTNVIEILVLQALAHHTRDDPGAAVTVLRRALTLAEPEGYVRIFADEGPPMASLLRATSKQGIASDHARRLLAAIDRTEDSTPVRQGLVEPLSDRELEVLRLLGTDLGGPDIARHLVVSLNTVRTHTRNIYAKLGVNNRRAAVRRGEELQLLTRSHDRTAHHHNHHMW